MIKQIKARRRPRPITDLRDLVVSTSEAYGDKTLYIYRENGTEKSFSYRDSLDYMRWFSAALDDIGLGGARIAIIGETHPYYMTAYYTAVNNGGVAIPLDRELREDEIQKFLIHAKADAVVYTSQFNEYFKKHGGELSSVKAFVAINPDGDFKPEGRYHSFSGMIESGREAYNDGRCDIDTRDIDMEKPCALLFTSGTTGTSKGVMLCQRNLTCGINASAFSTECDDTNTYVSVLPIHHSYAMTCQHLAMQLTGGTVYINPSLKNTLRSFQSFKPDTLILVPLFVETIYKRIWAEIDKKNLRVQVRATMKASDALLKVGIDVRGKLFSGITGSLGGNLRAIICGGAALDPKLITDFESFGITIFEGYGITECSPLVAVNRVGKQRLRSVGCPVENCEARIDKQDEDDKTGEIVVRGDNVMLGYYENPEATKEAFTEDGWFRTGDIGYIDRDGYVYITGRRKSVIILSNGKNVFPEELEEYLGKCPLIRECVVLGRENERGETVITAVVYPDPDRLRGKTDSEIYGAVYDAINSINRSLPTFKQIRALEIRGEEFEKTSSQKIKRYSV